MPPALLIFREMIENVQDLTRVSMRIIDIPAGRMRARGVRNAVQGRSERVGTLEFSSKRQADVFVNAEGAINGMWPMPTCFQEKRQTQWIRFGPVIRDPFVRRFLPPATASTRIPLYGPVVIAATIGEHAACGLSAEDMAEITLFPESSATIDVYLPELRIGRQSSPT